MSTESYESLSFSSESALVMLVLGFLKNDNLIYHKFFFRNGNSTATRVHTNRNRANGFWCSLKNVLVIIGIGVIALIVGITFAYNYNSNMSVLVSLYFLFWFHFILCMWAISFALQASRFEDLKKHLKANLKENKTSLKHSMEKQLARLEKWYMDLDRKVSSITGI